MTRLRRRKMSWLPTLMSQILWTLYQMDDRVSPTGERRGWIGSVLAWMQNVFFDCLVVSVLLPGAIAWTMLQLCSQAVEWCRRIGSKITGNSVIGDKPAVPSPSMFKINAQDYL